MICHKTIVIAIVIRNFPIMFFPYFFNQFKTFFFFSQLTILISFTLSFLLSESQPSASSFFFFFTLSPPTFHHFFFYCSFMPARYFPLKICSIHLAIYKFCGFFAIFFFSAVFFFTLAPIQNFF